MGDHLIEELRSQIQLRLIVNGVNNPEQITNEIIELFENYRKNNKGHVNKILQETKHKRER